MKKFISFMLLSTFSISAFASKGIEFVETKDFRPSGNYLYKIVGKTGNADCHICGGIVEISAFDKSGKLVAKGSKELGSWGKPLSGWKFKKSKGKVVAYAKYCFTGQGQTECETQTATVSGKKVNFN